MSSPAKSDGEEIESDPRWMRVVNRDVSADGAFVYAVKSTGIYCRPSCPSRRAKPANVRFFASPTDAEAAGYRACRRCNPKGRSSAQAKAAIIANACRLIEQADEIPRFEALADSVGMSPFHFHRQFKAVTGLTPKAYAAAQRSKRVRSKLAEKDASVTHAIYSAGFGSPSRFYERANAVLGMTPTAFRHGGRDVAIHFAVTDCSLGALLVACTNKGICAITLGDDSNALIRDLYDQFPRAELVGRDSDFEQVVAEVVRLVEAPQVGLDLPLDVRGTAFQHRVWQALREVPAGQTASYAEIARRIGQPKAVRAVAQACGANPIAVAIPCHRIIRNDGDLSGYRWGVARKRALLAKETTAMSSERGDHPSDEAATES